MYSAYTLFFLFIPLSAYPKPRTAFLEEREDDEDPCMNYDDSTCLSWKKILSLTADYYEVNSLLAQPDVYYDENFILPKSMHLCMIRFEGATSVARDEEEQLDMELDKELDMELDMKNTSGCTREEREAGAPSKEKKSSSSDI